jgi:hypothetical protein
MRHFINRMSFCASLAFLCAIPLGFVVEVLEWGQMPEDFLSGFFSYAVLFAIVNQMTTPRTAVTPPAPSPDAPPESD